MVNNVIISKRESFICHLTALLPLCCAISSCSNGLEDPPAIPDPPKESHMKLNVNDSLIMVKMYKTIGPWVYGGWNLKDYTTWLGVSTAFDVSSQELRIVGFNVIAGSFHGEIPEEIGDLSELRILIMAGGDLTGRIPETIGKLKHLEYLCLANNHLFGEIPASIGNLKNLSHLEIGYNKISGKLPESIGNLTRLKRLDISNTNVSGEIPKSFGNLKETQIWLDNNKLEGTFPYEIMEGMKYQPMLTYNNITDLPAEIWNDNNTCTIIPDLQGNRISSKIPKWVTQQKKWQHRKWCIERQQEGYGYVLE